MIQNNNKVRKEGRENMEKDNTDTIRALLIVVRQCPCSLDFISKQQSKSQLSKCRAEQKADPVRAID